MDIDGCDIIKDESERRERERESANVELAMVCLSVRLKGWMFSNPQDVLLHSTQLNVVSLWQAPRAGRIRLGSIVHPSCILAPLYPRENWISRLCPEPWFAWIIMYSLDSVGYFRSIDIRAMRKAIINDSLRSNWAHWPRFNVKRLYMRYEVARLKRYIEMCGMIIYRKVEIDQDWIAAKPMKIQELYVEGIMINNINWCLSKMWPQIKSYDEHIRSLFDLTPSY